MNFRLIKGHEGFSLLEVLVALSLVALIFSLVTLGSSSPREKIDEALNNIERSVRFASDESTIRNAVIRLHFFMDKTPNEFAVEYGPADSFMLPAPSEESSVKSLADVEKAEKDQKKLNQNFNRVKEFQEKNATLPDDVRLIAVGTSVQANPQSEGQPSLYMFPTGEKDSAIIIVGNNEEVAALSVDGFSGDIERVYKKIEDVSKDNLNETQLKMAQDLFKEWQKK